MSPNLRYPSMVNAKSLVYFIGGLLFGFFFAMLYLLSAQHTGWTFYQHHGYYNDPHNGDILQNDFGPEYDIFGYTHNHKNNRSVADQLYKDVRILCLVMTYPHNHETKAIHVLRTWGKRCNKIVFMSTKKDVLLGAVALPVKEGPYYLWKKTKEAFKYVFQFDLNEADWFLKTDDDTYVIMENLRYMLYSYSPNDPIYFGHKIKSFKSKDYMSGGAGHVLSKEALRLFVEKALRDDNLCRPEPDGLEEEELSICLQNAGVIVGDSRDSKGRGRFFPFVPEHHLIPPTRFLKFWNWNHIVENTSEGFDCCSDNAISFHYISPNQMYVLEYLIYHLHPYGVVLKQDDLPHKYLENDTKTVQTEDYM